MTNDQQALSARMAYMHGKGEWHEVEVLKLEAQLSAVTQERDEWRGTAAVFQESTARLSAKRAAAERHAEQLAEALDQMVTVSPALRRMKRSKVGDGYMARMLARLGSVFDTHGEVKAYLDARTALTAYRERSR